MPRESRALADAKQARRARLEAELGARIRALPDRRYGVILADPPWRFEPYSRSSGMGRAADNHYPTSPLGEIKSLEVASIVFHTDPGAGRRPRFRCRRNLFRCVVRGSLALVSLIHT
jgi:hypothetical protein